MCMKKNITLFMMLLAAVMMTGCSSSDDEVVRNDGSLDIEKLAQWTEAEVDVNDLYLKSHELRNSWQEEDCDGWKITRDGRGQVTKVRFEDNSRQQPPKNGEEFFAILWWLLSGVVLKANLGHLSSTIPCNLPSVTILFLP